MSERTFCAAGSIPVKTQEKRPGPASYDTDGNIHQWYREGSKKIECAVP